jgi:hypothetical protein
MKGSGITERIMRQSILIRTPTLGSFGLAEAFTRLGNRNNTLES